MKFFYEDSAFGGGVWRTSDLALYMLSSLGARTQWLAVLSAWFYATAVPPAAPRHA